MKYIPYLCGGTFFCIILESCKSRSRQHIDPIDRSMDQLSDSHIMQGLNYVITGVECCTKVDVIKTPVSQYKSCILNRSRYLALTQPSDINTFENELKQKNCDIFVRMSQFIEKYINEKKCEILVKSLIETIINDTGISSTEQFYTTANKTVEKRSLAHQSFIEIVPFLISILHFIVTNRLDNRQGRDTFLAWFEKSNGSGPWVMKQNLNLGMTIDQKIIVSFTSSQKSSLTTTPLKDATLELGKQQEYKPKVPLSPKYPKTIILDYYNLLVFDEEDFLPNKVRLDLDKLLPPRFTPNKIYEEYKGRTRYWTPNAIEKKKLKSYPILLIPAHSTNRVSHIRKAYVGFIDNIQLSGLGVIIEWHAILSVSLNDIHFLQRALDLQAMEEVETELQHPHWTIKCVDLFNALSQSPGITFPAIPKFTTVLPVIFKSIESNTHEHEKNQLESFYLSKYELSRKELEPILGAKHDKKRIKLEILNHYYGDNVYNSITITKSYYFPSENVNIFSALKKEILVLEQHDVISNEDFTNTLPGLHLLVESLPEFTFPEDLFKIKQFEQLHRDKLGQLNDIITRFTTSYNELMQAFSNLKNASDEKLITLEKDFKLLADTFSTCKTTSPLVLHVLSAQPEVAPTLSELRSMYNNVLSSNETTKRFSHDIQVAFLNYLAALLNTELENYRTKQAEWKDEEPILKSQIDSLYHTLKEQETEIGKLIESIFPVIKRNKRLNTPELKQLYQNLSQYH